MSNDILSKDIYSPIERIANVLESQSGGQGGSQGGGESNILWVPLTYSGATGYSAEVTFDEIVAAVNDGKDVMVYQLPEEEGDDFGNITHISYIGADIIYFFCAYTSSGSLMTTTYTVDSSNHWNVAFKNLN